VFFLGRFYFATTLVPGAQSQSTRPPSVPCQADGLQGRREINAVNDLLRMELMAECLGKLPAFLVQEGPCNPRGPCNPNSSKILLQRHFVLSKILAPVRREIAIRSSSALSRFPTLAIGNSSNQAAVWLSCAASNRQWAYRFFVLSKAFSESLQARSSQAECISFCRCG